MTTQIDTTGLGPAGLLIAKGWTQGAFSRDVKGNSASLMRGAVCWCALGAIAAVYSGETFQPLEKLYGAIGTCSVFSWNDHPERTHAEVIEAFRKAGV